MRKSDNFILKKVTESYVLIPFGENAISFNGVITLNESAAFLWENSGKEFNKESLTLLLCDHYGIDTATAEKSADKFINTLKDVGAVG